MDTAARTRQRILALFLPIAAVLYISAEALSPKGTDQVATDTATALKLLAIAAQHPTQVYIAGTFAVLGLGALAVSYAAIAALARNRGSALATVAALIGGIGAFCGAIVEVFVFPNVAAAATAHTTRAAAAQFLVTTFNSGFGHVFLYVYFIGIYVAPLLMGIALWRSRSRSALAGRPVLRRPGSRPAANIRRARRHLVHAALRGSDDPARGKDLAGGYAACQPATTGTGQRPPAAVNKGIPAETPARSSCMAKFTDPLEYRGFLRRAYSS